MKTKPPLRGREAEVIAELRRSLEVRGRVPTMKEIMHDIDIARGTITRILPRLVKKGYLTGLPVGLLRYRILDEPLPVTGNPE